MHIKLDHSFDKAEAAARVRKALADARPQMPKEVAISREEWQGDTLYFAFTVQGQHIEGTLEVADTAYIVDAKLPLMMRLFEGRIKQAIEEQIARLPGLR